MKKHLPHTVYRLFDADDLLLYVGLSCNFGQRIEMHRAEQPWWLEVARITTEHFSDRDTASVVEVRAIVSEAPKYNVKDNPRVKPKTRVVVSTSSTGPRQQWSSDRERITAYVTASRAAQGLSPKVEDPAVLARVARLIIGASA